MLNPAFRPKSCLGWVFLFFFSQRLCHIQVLPSCIAQSNTYIAFSPHSQTVARLSPTYTFLTAGSSLLAWPMTPLVFLRCLSKFHCWHHFPAPTQSEQNNSHTPFVKISLKQTEKHVQLLLFGVFYPSHVAGHLSAKTWTANNIIPGNVSSATEDFWVMMP